LSFLSNVLPTIQVYNSKLIDTLAENIVNQYHYG